MAQLDKTPGASGGDVRRSRERSQDRQSKRGIQQGNVPLEFGEGQVNQAVQLAHAVATVLDEAITVADQFPELLSVLVRQRCGGWAFLLTKPSKPQSVERVGPGACQRFLLEPSGLERIEDGHREPSGNQSGGQVPPIMPCGFQHHELDRP
jgi:hypothetical protein